MIIQRILFETTDGKVFEDEDEAKMHDFELNNMSDKYTCYDKDLHRLALGDPDTVFIHFGDMTEEELDYLFDYIYDYTELGFTYEDRSLFKPNSVIFYDDAGLREEWFTWESSPAKEEFDRLNTLRNDIDSILWVKGT